jgi:Domain of unknown function (DUF3885)
MQTLDLLNYLGHHYPGLSLGGGLFCRWPVGIRFALGGRGPDPETMAVVKMRAVTLYENAFSPQDDCVVISQDYRSDEDSISLKMPQPLFRLASRLDIGFQDHVQQIELRDENAPDEPSTYLLKWVVQSSRSFRYEAVLEGIANADHAIEPAVGSWVYFYNLRTDVILHMYDDRGLDVIATKPDTIVALYKQFNDWILDYDRHRIDAVFTHLVGQSNP